MTTYILRRLVHAVIVLVLITLLTFLAMHLLPGDPIYMLMTPGEFSQASVEQIEILRREFGLDKPILIQYINWFLGVLRGDFGISIIPNK